MPFFKTKPKSEAKPIGGECVMGFLGMHAVRQLNGVSDPLVYDASNREAVGVAVAVIGMDVARVEV